MPRRRQLLLAYRYELNIVGGAIIIAFGLFMLGLVRPGWLERDLRIHAALRGGRPVAAYVLGLGFAFGWTPCIGPVLGAILTVSAASATAVDGVALLAIYSLGLGVPFLLAALFTDSLAARLKAIGRIGRVLQVIAAGVMIVMGVAMITGHLSTFAFWLLETFPMLGRIGQPAMGLYADRILPALVDLSMRNKLLRPYRERVTAAAEGRVLDVGIGSGLNLPLYVPRAEELIGLEPSQPLLERARKKTELAHAPVQFIEGTADAIPLDDRSIDTVVMTWTGCSIPDIRAGLAEMRRVLRPGGRLVFVEHEAVGVGTVAMPTGIPTNRPDANSSH